MNEKIGYLFVMVYIGTEFFPLGFISGLMIDCWFIDSFIIWYATAYAVFCYFTIKILFVWIVLKVCAFFLSFCLFFKYFYLKSLFTLNNLIMENWIHILLRLYFLGNIYCTYISGCYFGSVAILNCSFFIFCSSEF